jgi:hypothetical protein
MVKHEGDAQVGSPGPYPVSYRAVVPKKGECENLLVPWSLSASHMAYEVLGKRLLADGQELTIAKAK